MPDQRTITKRGRRRLARVTVLAVAGTVLAGPPGRAAEPAEGTIRWGETVEWSGGPLNVANVIVTAVVLFGDQCAEGLCDEFLLDVDVEPSPSPAYIRFVQVEVDASDPDAAQMLVIPPAADPARDFILYEQDAARLLDPEPGVWRIRVICLFGCEGLTYEARATTGTVQMPRAVSHRAGGEFLGERGDVRGRMDQVSAQAFEPTLGVTENGSVLYQAWTIGLNEAPPRVLRSTDEGESWEDVSPKVGPLQRHRNSNDPYLHVDPDTSRVFTIDYQINPVPTAVCHELSFTDDVDGTAEAPDWTTTAVCGEADFQKLFTGPPVTSPTVGYDNVVYVCAVNGGVEVEIGIASVMTTCSKSLDGGLTFVPTGTPPFTDDPEQTDGVGIHGHCTGHAGPGDVGPDGTVYVPRGGCGQPELAISHDEGATWERVQVADNGIHRRADPNAVGPSVGWEFPNPQETAVAADEDGNVYYTWVARDRLPYLAVSTDGGESWGEPIMVAPPGLREANHSDIDVGATGQVALAYMGSENSPGPPFPDEELQCEEGNRFQNTCVGGSFAEDPDEAYADVTWNGYITVSDDVLTDEPRFLSAPVNDPSDPLVRGLCGPGGCPGAGDFFDVKIAPDGTPWAAFVDTCVVDRCLGGLISPGGEGIAGRLVGRR